MKSWQTTTYVVLGALCCWQMWQLAEIHRQDDAVVQADFQNIEGYIDSSIKAQTEEDAWIAELDPSGQFSLKTSEVMKFLTPIKR